MKGNPQDSELKFRSLPLNPKKKHQIFFFELTEFRIRIRIIHVRVKWDPPVNLIFRLWGEEVKLFQHTRAQTN